MGDEKGLAESMLVLMVSRLDYKNSCGLWAFSVYFAGDDFSITRHSGTTSVLSYSLIATAHFHIIHT